MNDAAAHNPASVERFQGFLGNLLVRGKNRRLNLTLDVDSRLEQLIAAERGLGVQHRRDDSGVAKNLLVDHDS